MIIVVYGHSFYFGTDLELSLAASHQQELEWSLAEAHASHQHELIAAKTSIDDQFAVTLEIVREQHSNEIELLEQSLHDSKQMVAELQNKLTLTLIDSRDRDQYESIIRGNEQTIEILTSDIRQLSHNIKIREESISLLERSLQVTAASSR